MTKLTVAEASKRGYATSLSILQAVQKSWLTAEKSPDGQMLVDAGDLERLFGRPVGPTPASAPPPPGDSRLGQPARGTPEEPDSQITAFDEARDDSVPGLEEADEDGPEPDEGWGAKPISTDLDEEKGSPDDSHALRAEIARLQQDLAAERRRTAALLDVLAGRLVSVEADAAPSPDPGDDEMGEAVSTAAGTATGGDEADVADDGTDVQHDAVADTDRANDSRVSDIGEIADTSDRPLPDTESATPDPLDAGTTQSAGDDLAMPTLTAPSHSRSISPSPAIYRRPTSSPETSSMLWQIWSLAAFVWIVLIGAFFWYIADLGDDLWVIAQWIRGESAADTAQFTAASHAALRAARDMFGPPAVLLGIMLGARALLRAFRR